MEADEVAGGPESPTGRAGKAAKWAFVVCLMVAAAIIGFFTIFRAPPAEATVAKAFAAIEEGDVEGFISFLDPEGQLGRMWNDDSQGARGAVMSLLEQYRLEFSSLEFSTRSEGDAAEVELRGGRVTIYNQGEDGPPAAYFDLDGSDLVFYVEKKDGSWLIEGVNYDTMEFLSGDVDLFPF